MEEVAMLIIYLASGFQQRHSWIQWYHHTIYLMGRDGFLNLLNY